MKDHPATRVLAILELLQARGRMSGADLARHTGVDRRTVRRYVALLESLGIPVTTERGPLGGYGLVAGFKLPPMMFTNDEAMAVSLGLAAVRELGLSGAAPAVASARAKLERVLPAEARARVRATEDSVAFERLRSVSIEAGPAFGPLCAAAHSRHSVRIRYRSAEGEETERTFDPYGLAFRGGRWYTAGHCHLRKGLRTFRLDRVLSAEPAPGRFERPRSFDVLEHLAASIALLPRKFAVEVRLETDLESARRELFAAFGILTPARGGHVTLHGQTDDLDWFARELARLPWPFEVICPDELRGAIRRHARALRKSVK